MKSLADTTVNTIESNSQTLETGTSLGERAETITSDKDEFMTVTFVEPSEQNTVKTRRITDLINPFPKQFPQNVASRKRLLVSGTIPAPAGLVPTVVTHNAFNLYRALSRIFDVLSLFKAIRFDMHLNIVIRASAGMYGAYGAAYQYGEGDVDIISIMSSDVWIGDISTSEAIDMVIPYRFTHNFLASDPAKDLAYAQLHILNFYSASLDGGTTTLDYDIFASLDNVDGAIPTENCVAFPQSKQHLVGAGMAIGRAIGVGMDALYGTHMSEPEQKVNLTYEHTIHKKTNHKAGANNVYDLHDESVDVLKEAASNYEKLLGGVSGKHHGVRQSFFGDLSTITPNDSIPSLGEETVPTRAYAPQAHLMGSDMTIEQVGKLPGIARFISFLSTTPTGTAYQFIPRLGGTRSTALGRPCYDYASYYARYARYWRGDHKYVFHFFTSPLISARFRVTINYLVTTDDSIGLLALDNSYEVPSEVFLVKGSCVKSITIPWLSTHSVCPVSTANCVVNLELIEPPNTTSTVATTVYCIVTHSMDNFELYSLQHGMSTEFVPPPPNTETKGPKIVYPQSNLRKIHSEASEVDFQSERGYVSVNMPKIESVLDIMRRFDDNTAGITSIDTMPAAAVKLDFDQMCNLITASQPFAFISGSVENRFYYGPAAFAGQTFATLGNFIDGSNTYAGNGQSATIIPEWPILDFRTPYRASVPMVYRKEPAVSTQPPNMADVLTGTTGVLRYLIRAGPDFAVHYPNYLPGAGWTSIDAIG